MDRESMPTRWKIDQAGHMRSLLLEVVQMGSLVAGLLAFARTGVTPLALGLVAVALVATVLQLVLPRPPAI